MNNLKAGFVPFLVVAIVAALAIGGGVYAVKKNNDKKAALEDNLETQANANADANANVNANLGVNANGSGKATIMSFLDLKKNAMCTFDSTDNDMTSKGTIYISAEGNLSGDFVTTKSGTSTTSHMVVKSGVAYVWTGSQGAKMDLSSLQGSASAQAKSYVDVNSEVDYSCEDWTVDASKFNLPSGVTFVDIEAMLKGSLKLPGTN
jgi:hypothetical protein